VNRGRYAYLLVAPPSLRSPTPPELSWLESDTSAVQIVLRAGGGVLVLGISGPLHPQTCTDAMLGIGH
jgi:hypothetical protein